MYQDFNNLSDFYKTNIGRSLKNLISEKIKKYVSTKKRPPPPPLLAKGGAFKGCGRMP